MNKYKIKQKNQDFFVSEVSLLPALCSKEKAIFSYIWVEKIDMTTFDALDEIKNIFKLKEGEVSAQGLKDEDGVTQQLISIKKIIDLKQVKTFNKKFISNNPKLEIKNIQGYGKEPLIPRHLHGNNFKLIIRNLTKKQAELLCDYCRGNRFISFINYYDNQRFGIVGGKYNTHLIGKAIVEKNWLKALEEFKKSKNKKGKNLNFPEKNNQLASKKFFQEIDFLRVRFFISSYNSFLWNQAVVKYLGLEKRTFINFPFEKIGFLRVPQKDNFKIFNILTSNGYEIKRDYQIVKKPTKRNLFVTTTIFPEEIKKDSLNKGKYSLPISFFLPTGCYATMMIKQIIIRLSNKNK